VAPPPPPPSPLPQNLSLTSSMQLCLLVLLLITNSGYSTSVRNYSPLHVQAIVKLGSGPSRGHSSQQLQRHRFGLHGERIQQWSASKILKKRKRSSLFSAPSAKKAGEEADKDLSTFSGSVAGKSIPAVATLLYIYWVFVSELPPGNSLVNSDPSTLKLAMELSENFWFILPALNFDWVPSINPVMEGLFNFVVTWMIMMFGFYSEERYQRRVKMLPFLAMMPFLTNAVYLPYLAIREPTGKALSLDGSNTL